MIEVLTTLATAICGNCQEEIKQMTGGLTAARWYHTESTNAEYCPDAPMATPLDDTFRLVSRDGGEM